MTAAGNKS